MTNTQRSVPALKQLVADGGRILYRLGLVDYLGHVSARTADGNIVIKPKHSPTIRGLNHLTADDIILVDPHGQLLAGENAPPSEIFIHTEIYRQRPYVNSVVHTHQPSSTIMGIINEPILPLVHIPSSYVGPDDIGLWPCPLLVTDAELGIALASALGDKSYCHLQGHGIVSVGESVEAAVVGAVLMEELSVVNLAVLATGKRPRVITADELSLLKQHRGAVAGRWAYLLELAGTPAS